MALGCSEGLCAPHVVQYTSLHRISSLTPGALYSPGENQRTVCTHKGKRRMLGVEESRNVLRQVAVV